MGNGYVPCVYPPGELRVPYGMECTDYRSVQKSTTGTARGVPQVYPVAVPWICTVGVERNPGAENAGLVLMPLGRRCHDTTRPSTDLSVVIRRITYDRDNTFGACDLSTACTINPSHFTPSAATRSQAARGAY
jgi:hypothetical protein